MSSLAGVTTILARALRGQVMTEDEILKAADDIRRRRGDDTVKEIRLMLYSHRRTKPGFRILIDAEGESRMALQDEELKKGREFLDDLFGYKS